MQDYREYRAVGPANRVPRVALVVPVPCAGHEDEPGLLHRHRYTIAQARALARTGALAVHLFVDAPFGAELRLEDDVRFHALPPLRAWTCAGRGPSTPLPSPLGRGWAWARRQGLDFPVGVYLLRAAHAVEPHAVHLFHLLDVKTLAAATLSPSHVFAEYNGGSLPAALPRRGVMRAASGALAGVFFTARGIARPFVEAGALSPAVPVHAVPEISTLLRFEGDRRLARGRVFGDCDDLLVLIVARIARDKDPVCALEAFRRIVEIRPHARLVWAALTDELGGEIQARISADPLLARQVEIRWSVPSDRMADLYAAADVMLHPSRREICGVAFIEALQAGLPVAASDIASFRALAGSDGARLCRIGDANAFAEAALALAFDSAARRRARKRFLSALSFDAIALRKLAVYRGETISAEY